MNYDQCTTVANSICFEIWMVDSPYIMPAFAIVAALIFSRFLRVYIELARNLFWPF